MGIQADALHEGNYISVERKTMRLAWKMIVPFSFLLYFFNTMDRANISFAALRMGESMTMTAMDFGNVVSAFFISYLIFQIPSNMIIERIGAKRWIGTIIIGWGLSTMVMFFVTSITQVIWARFLLGIFEAGFFPGMIYYMALWFPGRERARVTAFFMLAAMASAIVAGPISGYIVGHFHVAGYEGWRWLFMIEGVPTVLLGILCFFVFADGPETAKWLPEEGRAWLTSELKREQAKFANQPKAKLADVLMNVTLWKLAAVYMCVQAAVQTAQLYMPRLFRAMDFGLSDSDIGWVMAIPYAVGFIALPLWGMSSDRTGERKWHSALPMAAVSITFVVMALTHTLSAQLAAVAIFGFGMAYMGPYWPMPSAMLTPSGLAVSIAFINSCSSLGGFLGGKILGYVDQTYGMTGAFWAMAIMPLLSILVLITLRVPRERKA